VHRYLPETPTNIPTEREVPRKSGRSFSSIYVQLL
jgi:hypothetical protein